jgi:hypothetical protein
MANTRPDSFSDLKEITTRNTLAQEIITGFSAGTPALAEFWDYLTTALSDTRALTAELSAIRLDRDNLLAAIRATLAAHADGEPDPLYYIRDELNAHQTDSQRPGESS